MSKKSHFVVKLLKYKTMKNTQLKDYKSQNPGPACWLLWNRLTPLVCVYSSQRAQTWSDFHLF